MPVAVWLQATAKKALACGARAGLRETGLADCHAFETHTKVLA
jgi:hypothetical protein